MGIYPENSFIHLWQQDGSGVHRAGEVWTFIRNKMPDYVQWPPYSPDLSPIENIWGWLKHQVSKDRPKTVEAMKKCIRKHWKDIDEEFLAPYFASMRRRMEMLLEYEGGKIKY